jgi:flagellar biosynthetic protein FliR
VSGAGTFDLFGLSEARFETLLLVVIRITIMLSQVPIFSGTQIPITVRLGLGFLLTFVVAQTVPTLAAPLELGPFIVAILAQAFIGLVFGFVAFLVFTGIQFGGAILDVQVGFGAVSVLNPLSGQQVTIVSEFEIALASILYLVSDSHHQLLAGMAGSFALLPLPWVGMDSMLTTSVVTFLSQALFIVLRIAGPVAIVLFLTNVALGLMSRVAPQMNVYSVGLPLQMLVGLSMIIITLPLLGAVLPEVFAETPRQLDTVLRHMQPSPTPSALPIPSALPAPGR